MQIPTVPAFVTGDTSITKLRQLSQCVSFVSCAQNYPLWHFYRQSTYTLVTASQWYTIPMTATAFDSDRVGSTSGATIVTQGYYTCEGTVPFVSMSSANNGFAAFLWTAGAANPNYSTGTTIQFGLKSGRIITGTGANEVLSIADMCPAVCYPGDTIALQATGALANTVVDCNNPTSVVAGRFNCNFTGRWVRIGS